MSVKTNSKLKTERKKRVQYTPMNCPPNKIHAMERDNLSSGNYWILLDGDEVVMAAQRRGEMPTAKLQIPRKNFKVFVRWFAGLASHD